MNVINLESLENSHVRGDNDNRNIQINYKNVFSK